MRVAVRSLCDPANINSTAPLIGPDGKPVSPATNVSCLQRAPAANGLMTVVKYQRVLTQRYFDVAGFPGRTVGLTVH